MESGIRACLRDGSLGCTRACTEHSGRPSRSIQSCPHNTCCLGSCARAPSHPNKSWGSEPAAKLDLARPEPAAMEDAALGSEPAAMADPVLARERHNSTGSCALASRPHGPQGYKRACTGHSDHFSRSKYNPPRSTCCHCSCAKERSAAHIGRAGLRGLAKVRVRHHATHPA